MSQEKVDRYKEYKANKKEILKKEKRMRKIEYTVAVVVLVAVIGWLGYSVYDTATDPANQEKVEYTLDTTAVDDYIDTVGTAE